MIRRLFEIGCFDYQKFILNNLKALSLDNDEAIVLIKLLNNYENNKSFSADLIASAINQKYEDVEKALTNLSERGFYKIFLIHPNGLGEETISIDGFFKKCKSILEYSQTDNKDELFRITQLVQENLKRILTSNELDIITSLVQEDRYNYKNFEDAIKMIQDKKKSLTIRQLAAFLSKINKDEAPAPQVKKQDDNIIKDFFELIK